MKKSLFFIPNGITVLRVLLTVWFIRILAGRLLSNSAASPAALYLLFAGICLSDFLDGKVARGLKAESALGGMLDVSADGLFLFSSLIVFDHFNVLPVWFTGLVFADFLVFLATSRFLARRKRKGPRRALVFDTPGRIAALLYYFVPIAAWVAFSHPGHQSRWALNALLSSSALLSGVSLSKRLFFCFAALRNAPGQGR